ncbi:MAG: hypothetical protein RTU92_14070 [Candidatus Thorarchaeota archaeon]
MMMVVVMAWFGAFMLWGISSGSSHTFGWEETTMWICFVIGAILIGPAIILIRQGNRFLRTVQSVIEIAAVRKSVTIAEIVTHTGLDHEFVLEVLTDALVTQRLFGYIEGDEFIRDVSARPARSQGAALFDD